MNLLAALLVIAAVFAAVMPAAAQGEDVDEACRALMTMGMDMAMGEDTPAVRIVAPAAGDTIYGESVTVKIEAENFEIAQGAHWHVWVDGELRGMVYDDTTWLKLEPGTHTICAILGDAEHMELGEPGGVIVTVAEAAAGTPTSVPVDANASAPQAEPGAPNPITLVGIIVAGVLAAVAGWFVGTRLPKGRR